MPGNHPSRDLLYYLAHPYSGPDPEVEAQNFEKANILAGALISMGFHVYSPISHTHPIHLKSPQNWETWLTLDEQFVDRCDGLILSPGWESSKGCLKEKAWFEEQGKPVFFIHEFAGV